MVMRFVNRLAKLTGSSGTVIGSRFALRLQPRLLGELARGREVITVSATNGKTTTTRFLAAALSARGPVATNATGSNLATGIATALASNASRQVVLEVDEGVLPRILRECSPTISLLMNLSRDQLDRYSEVRKLADAWRQQLVRSPAVTVVANCDDPMVVFAAEAASRVVWVAAGSSWRDDSGSCPRCRSLLSLPSEVSGHWECSACDFQRPSPTWLIDRETGRCSGPGFAGQLILNTPGSFNLANAAMALAAASATGLDPVTAAEAIGKVADVAGRYKTFRVANKSVRLLLAKNPAGWAEMLKLAREPETAVVLALNARDADGRDTSWIWDVPFEVLASSEIAAAGDRHADMNLRLIYANHRPVASAIDAVAATKLLSATTVDVIANYTAFADIFKALGK